MHIPNGQICFTQILPDMYTFWIPILCYESLLVTLAFLHGVNSYKVGQPGRNVFRMFDHQKLTQIFIRDSVIYFMA